MMKILQDVPTLRRSLAMALIGLMTAGETFALNAWDKLIEYKSPTEMKASLVSGSVSGMAADCFGASTGSISITNPTGGGGTYEYSINGGTTWSAAATYNNVPAGTYHVMIRDAASPTNVATLYQEFMIAEPGQMSATVSKVDVTICNGNKNATITVSGAQGGSENFLYSSNGGTSWQTSNIFKNVQAGTYHLQIADGNVPACRVTLNSNLVITEPLKMTAGVTPTNVTGCNGNTNGNIIIAAASGGGGSYQFSINGGTSWPGTGTAFSFSNLAAGAYNVQMRDATVPSCVSILNSALVITQPVPMSATVTSTSVTVCNGNANGGIAISGAAGGSGNFQYSCDGGTAWVGSGTAYSFTGLPAGAYNVQLRDANNPSCKVILNSNLNITQPAKVSATVTPTNVAGCYGASNGGIQIIAPTGGSGTYEYSMNGGAFWASSASFTNLLAGTYHVMIRDKANPTCSVVLNGALQLTQPQALAASINSINATCHEYSNGQITVNNATGGGGAYEYSFNNGSLWSASKTASGLAPGNYGVMVRDAATPTCILNLAVVVIDRPAALVIESIDVTSSCPSSPTGTASAVVSGGTGPFVHTWTGNATVSNNTSLTNAAPGNYMFKVEDKNGCIQSEQVIMTALPLAPSIFVEGITLKAPANAASYQWYRNGQILSTATASSVEALQSGLYKVVLNSTTCGLKDSLVFNGITWDQANGVLVVPQVAQATYEWYYNNVKITGASGRTYPPTQNGLYKATITFNNANARTLALLQAVYEYNYDGTVTGLSGKQVSTFEVFPNPGNGLVHLKAAFDLTGMKATLFTSAGQEIWSQVLTGDASGNELNVQEAGKGIYYLKLNGNNHTAVSKVVIE